MPTLPALGRPGIYRSKDRAPAGLAGARMDVCAFVGVAPRGPARESAADTSGGSRPVHKRAQAEKSRSVAIPVESFDEYQRLYGAFGGPGLLPFAVASFFEQGGKRAYIVRVVHDYGEGDARNNAGVAGGWLPDVHLRDGGRVGLQPRNEGAWGNGLRLAIRYAITPLEFEDVTLNELRLDERARLPVGSLIRFRSAGGLQTLRFANLVRVQPRAFTQGQCLVVRFDEQLPEQPEKAETIEGILVVEDG